MTTKSNSVVPRSEYIGNFDYMPQHVTNVDTLDTANNTCHTEHCVKTRCHPQNQKHTTYCLSHRWTEPWPQLTRIENFVKLGRGFWDMQVDSQTDRQIHRQTDTGWSHYMAKQHFHFHKYIIVWTVYMQNATSSGNRQTRHRASTLIFRIWRYVVVATKPMHRLQIHPIAHYYRAPPFPKLHPGPCSSVEMRWGTDRQTAVINIHFASAMPHGKCKKVLCIKKLSFPKTPFKSTHRCGYYGMS